MDDVPPSLMSGQRRRKSAHQAVLKDRLQSLYSSGPSVLNVERRRSVLHSTMPSWSSINLIRLGRRCRIDFFCEPNCTRQRRKLSDFVGVERSYFVHVLSDDAGEVIDVDAITGGFNFQNAWTGGYIAAQGIIHSN